VAVYGAVALIVKADDFGALLARAATPVSPGLVAWVVRAAIDAVVGLAVGALVAPLAGKVLGPAVGRLKSLWPGRGA